MPVAQRLMKNWTPHGPPHEPPQWPPQGLPQGLPQTPHEPPQGLPHGPQTPQGLPQGLPHGPQPPQGLPHGRHRLLLSDGWLQPEPWINPAPLPPQRLHLQLQLPQALILDFVKRLFLLHEITQHFQDFFLFCHLNV